MILGFHVWSRDFEWRQGNNGDIYKVIDGRTAGASIGLTFDGRIDTAENILDINGTAAPISGLNSAIGKIPVIGDILTGGGALVAATYSIKGDTSDPQVNVNPLSVLAPGIIRKLLFESTPSAANDNKSSASKADKEALN